MTEHRLNLTKAIGFLLEDFPLVDLKIVDLGGSRNINYNILPSDRTIVNLSDDSQPDYKCDLTKYCPEGLLVEIKHCDIVIVSEVIEHLPSLDYFFKNILTHVSKNKSVLVTVPFMYHQHGDPLDFRRYTLTGIESLFLQNGFSTVKSTTIGDLRSTLFDTCNKFVKPLWLNVLLRIFIRLVRVDVTNDRVYSGSVCLFRRK